MRFREIPHRIAALGRKALAVVRDAQPFMSLSFSRNSLTTVDTNRGLSANVVMACIFWIQRAFTEAELVVQRRKPDGVWERVLDHDLEILIAKPNDVYDGDAMWKATALSYSMDGNAYWWKVRNNIGEVIQLWYIPHWMIYPISPVNDRAAIAGYQVMLGIKPHTVLSPRDVVHIRFGLDPEDTRIGLSPLKSVMREVESDMQAAEFSDTVLENMGIPGLILSPKDSTATPTPDQLKELRDYLATAATGGKRGSNLVFGKPTDVVQLGFDPNKVNLASTRDISEERVCAILGIPAAVVGFGAGLQSTKVGATMRELVKLAWVQCIMPMQHTMARQVTAQLLHDDFVGQARRFRARFDMTEASSFQEEFDLRVASTVKLVSAGLLRVDRAQQMLGLEVDKTREVYLIPTATPAVDPDAPVVEPVTAPTITDNSTDNPPANEPKAASDIQSLVNAIADRWQPFVARNGNGTHHSKN